MKVKISWRELYTFKAEEHDLMTIEGILLSVNSIYSQKYAHPLQNYWWVEFSKFNEQKTLRTQPTNNSAKGERIFDYKLNLLKRESSCSSASKIKSFIQKR